MLPKDNYGKAETLFRDLQGPDARIELDIAELDVLCLRNEPSEDAARPKLVNDGMFLVGLDIVGDKLLEINVFTPSGLNNFSRMSHIEFSRTVIEAIEEKMAIKEAYMPARQSEIEHDATVWLVGLSPSPAA